jgi:putative tricarboxylic transport membrane protein
MTGEPSGERRADKAGYIFAAALIALAAVIAWAAAHIGATASYSPVGPAAAPYAVAFGLAVLGLATGVAAWRGAIPEREPYDVAAVLTILAGLAALSAVIWAGGGFILGTAILFVATSRAFGHTRIVLDLAIGLALSISIYVVFTKLLSLSLPQGPFERLF